MVRDFLRTGLCSGGWLLLYLEFNKHAVRFVTSNAAAAFGF